MQCEQFSWLIVKLTSKKVAEWEIFNVFKKIEQIKSKNWLSEDVRNFKI